MDDKKAKNQGMNPFEDDANAGGGSQFSDDAEEGRITHDGGASKKKAKKKVMPKVVDEDLVEEKEDVKHGTKKKIKGYESNIKQYVSEAASKGQRSELKDSLGQEGVSADGDKNVKKKRKRKRRKKVVAEKIAGDEVAKVVEEKKVVEVPVEEVKVAEAPVVMEAPVEPVEAEEKKVVDVPVEVPAPVEEKKVVEEPKVVEEVKPINPFSESAENQFEDVKWRDFSEDKNEIGVVDEESVFEPEIVEEKKSQEVKETPVVEKEVPVAEKEIPVFEKKEPFVPEVADDKDGFLYMLEQAGITKGKIFGIFAALGFVILVIVVAFFIPFGEIVGNQKEEVSEVEVSEEQAVNSETKNAADGLDMSQILGNEYDYLVLGNDKISGAFFALNLGGEFVSSEHRFSYYMRHLNEMQNLYSTDIYKLLDQSYDRRATLTDFLGEMKNAIEKAKQLQSEVAKAASNLNAADVSANDQKDIFEQKFFTDIKDLRGQDSFVNLEKFVGFSQNAVRLRSYYKAYNYISEMYLNSLKNLEPRYRDILVNFDALVKGVHVFDVPGSEINAIIRLSQ
ncbi:MAG: hypothetical protein WC651_03435 [Candidatus Gracilibacteria bacterium]|jgi:hypothetical protein